MSSSILVAVIVFGVTGLILGIVLYAVSRKFTVEEDIRIKEITDLLPGANCGGCGYPGCAAYAEACINNGSLITNCSACDNDSMLKIAELLGTKADIGQEKVAVVRCDGSCTNRPRLVRYDGVKLCSVAHLTAGGDTGCFFGCLGCGDCVSVCSFDAIKMNPETGLPEVDQNKCTACGMCVIACPRSIIELRNKNKSDRRVYVSCVSKDKGAVAKKACAVACIGCGKCFDVCTFQAIIMADNLAYIDYEKCKLCRKCVDVCPQNIIKAVNFPERKIKVVELNKSS